MVERTAQTAAAIALATQQQLSASEQVVNSMHDVANMIGENAQKVASVSVASLELQRVARELRAEE
jgi:methyl-accepting chemotaxis protein